MTSQLLLTASPTGYFHALSAAQMSAAAGSLAGTCTLGPANSSNTDPNVLHASCSSNRVTEQMTENAVLGTLPVK